MSFQWMRRASVALVSVSLLALSACGEGTIESQFVPTRVISFGDSLSDLGSGGVNRYTVNDNTVNIWNYITAYSYAYLTPTPASTGGTFYATGNARVTLHPDAAGNAATPTVTEQITSFLGANTLSGANDLVLLNGGFSDIITENAKVKAGTQTTDQMIVNVGQAGRDLGAQVRRLVNSGAKHVVVAGVYDLGRTPWAIATSQVDLLSQASAKFNEQLLVSIVDLGDSVLYIDSAFLFNLMTSSPVTYAFADGVTPVCTSVDPGPGIGIGLNEVNSRLCTSATIISGATYNNYIFADKVYPTPAANAKLGDYAFSRIRARW